MNLFARLATCLTILSWPVSVYAKLPQRPGVPPEALAVLQTPDALEVLAIVCERKPRPSEDVFHEYPVVKRVSVGAAQQSGVVAALLQSIAYGREVARCFIPHHGVRAKRGNQSVDLVICYTCSQVVVHGPGSGATTLPIVPTSQNALGAFLGEKPIQMPQIIPYEGRNLIEWSDLVENSGVRRYTRSLPPELHKLVPAMVKAIATDPSPRVKLGACQLLRRLGAKASAAAPQLVAFLRESKDAGDRIEILRTLAVLGEAAAPALPELEALLLEDPPTRNLQLAAIRVIQELGTKAARVGPAVRRWAAKGTDTNVVQGAITLGKMGAVEEATVKQMVAHMSGAPWNVQRAVVEFLGNVRATSARTVVEGAMKHSDERVALAARVALAQLDGNPQGALPDVLNAISERRGIARRFAVDALVAIGGPAVMKELARLAEDRDDSVRQIAVQGLADMGPAARETLPVLEQIAAALTDRDEQLKSTVVDAVDRIREQ